jgi:hypothetical protein
MRGDILLLKSGGGARDRLVAFCTGGPYVHVDVDLGDGRMIGSHLKDGVAYRPVEFPERTSVISLGGRASAERIEEGVAWMLARRGHRFSWASMADFIMPETWVTFLWGRQSIYNCANLVARYLQITGGLDLPYGKRPPMILTPNDIARAAGLL